VVAPLLFAAMPSEKRQRQDEGRLMRLEAQRSMNQKVQRRRQARTLGLIIGAVVLVAGGIAIFSADDAEDTSTSDTTATTSGEPVEPGDPAIGTTPCPPEEGATERVTEFAEGPEACIDVTKTYTADIETSRGTFTVELYADRAPKAVNSFVFLARNKYYEGVAFHRIIPGFVVQGGDANGEPPGSGGPGYLFADELPTEGPPYYEIGSLAMANPGQPDSNGSQFFVVTGDSGVELPASYSLFGKVTSGMEVVREIEGTGAEDGTPTEETTITKVTITEE
jgi:cyclophilin family peptidyl-prolyl cis-trans isomerase